MATYVCQIIKYLNEGRLVRYMQIRERRSKQKYNENLLGKKPALR